MQELDTLIERVSQARSQFTASASGLTTEQANFKPAPEAWCIAEIVEHMVWAEHSGISGMWRAIEGIQNNRPVWTGEFVHKGLSIEQVIEKTWKEKEQVPEIAKPRWGGPVAYWIATLNACQNVLEALSKALEGLDVEQVIYPHIISGPLNVPQRIEFLRFHLQRHQKQIETIKAHPDFPAS
jgi:hypothetical protein